METVNDHDHNSTIVIKKPFGHQLQSPIAQWQIYHHEKLWQTYRQVICKSVRCCNIRLLILNFRLYTFAVCHIKILQLWTDKLVNRSYKVSKLCNYMLYFLMLYLLMLFTYIIIWLGEFTIWELINIEYYKNHQIITTSKWLPPLIIFLTSSRNILCHIITIIRMPHE